MSDIKNIEFKYEYVTYEDKKKVIEVQLRELEVTHFGLLMTEPSRLDQSQEHIQWRQQKSFIESSIKRLRNKKERFFGEEE
jgi:hypothetical protein